jgi:hypothetical protein
MPYNNEAPLPPERQRHVALLRPKHFLVKAAGRFKCLARGKHECASTKPSNFGWHEHDESEQCGENGNGRFKANRRASAGRAAVHRAQTCGDRARVRESVGVDEKEPITSGGARAGISRSGDLTIVDVDDYGAVPLRNLGGGIGRGVIRDDDVVAEVEHPRSVVNGLDRGRETGLFVVRGNDEGNHLPVRQPHRLRLTQVEVIHNDRSLNML